MTFEQQNKLVDQCVELWRTLLPDCEAPSKSQFLRWIGTFPEAAVLRGINRASAKVLRMKTGNAPMTPNDAHRYASAVMRSEAEGMLA